MFGSGSGAVCQPRSLLVAVRQGERLAALRWQTHTHPRNASVRLGYSHQVVGEVMEAAATAMRLAGSRVLIASLSASSSVLPPSSSLGPGQAWKLGKRRNGSVGWEKVASWAVDEMVAQRCIVTMRARVPQHAGVAKAELLHSCAVQHCTAAGRPEREECASANFQPASNSSVQELRRSTSRALLPCRCQLCAICWVLGISCTLRDFTNLPYHCPIKHCTAVYPCNGMLPPRMGLRGTRIVGRRRAEEVAPSV